MNQRLILSIDESWPQLPAAPWVLLDERDNVIEQGYSEPRHWPQAPNCEVVLWASQCSWLETTLPRTTARHQESVLRYALENQLLKDVDEQHLSVTQRSNQDDGVRANVIVVSRRRLRQILAQLENLGRSPVRVVSEMQTLAFNDEQPPLWTIAQGPGNGCVVRFGPQRALACDPTMLADMLCHLLEQPLDNDASTSPRPQGLRILRPGQIVSPSFVALDTDALHQATGLPCHGGETYAWWQGLHRANNLLHGEFENRQARSRFFSGIRLPLWLAGSSALIWLLFSLGNIFWQRYHLNSLENRMLRLFETTVPNTPAIAPAQQLARALDEQKMRHGQLRRDDFLSLLMAYGEIRGTPARHSLSALNYENSSLQLILRAETKDTDPDWTVLPARFNTLGYTFTPVADNDNRFSLTIKVP